MNPLAIFAIVIGLVTGYYVLSGSGFDLPFLDRFGSGPIATGPGSGAKVENPQPVSRGFFGFGAPSPAPGSEPAAPRPGESPYKGKVSIANVHRSGISADEEYVTIRYGGGGFFGFGGSADAAPVDVTDWSIASRRFSVTLPRAYNIPEIDAEVQDIILIPGGEVIILVGTQAYQKNFRENACAGYLNESFTFTPSLSNSCADSSPDRSQLISRGFSGACIDTIEAVRACRTPEGPFLAGVIGQGCIEHMNQNFSYAGCVRNHRDRGGFLGDTWRVSLRRTGKMFDPLHDKVTLRDASGLLVDEFEY